MDQWVRRREQEKDGRREGGSLRTQAGPCIHCLHMHRHPTICVALETSTWLNPGSLVPRPSLSPVFDRLQYAKTDPEGLVNLTM